MKQRSLTEIQLTLIRLEREGFGDEDIAYKMAIHPRTVRAKRAAILRGLAKGAYCNFPVDVRSPGLFE